MGVAALQLGDKAKRLLDFSIRHVFQGSITTFESVGLAIGLGHFAPGEGHHITLLHTLAKEIQCPEKKLGFGLALVGGFFKPGCSLDIILSDAETLVKQKAETRLRCGIAVFGEWIPVAERGDVVASIIRRQTRSKIAGRRWLKGRQQQRDEDCEAAERCAHRLNHAQMRLPPQPVQRSVSM
jgi:hypothetical protein